MPPQGRLDAPGPLHHVMIRQIEGANISWDDKDREYFLPRVGDKGKVTRTRILALALMDNFTCFIKAASGKLVPGNGN